MYRFFLLLALACIPLIAISYSTGPPAGRTGAPGDATCQDGCHNSFALNAGPGTVSITGPTSYAPGEVIEVTVSVTQNGISRYGFQLTAKDANEQLVGTFELVDATVTQFSGTGQHYVSHTLAGTNQNSWQVRWRAPDVGVGTVTFYAAAVAANGNGSNKGDYVYTAAHEVDEALTAVREDKLPDVFQTFEMFPTLARETVTIEYTLQSPVDVRIRVFDLLGRVVGVLGAGEQHAGVHRLRMETTSLSSGIYWVAVETPHGHFQKTFFVP